MKNHKNQFTLAEILVVITIIAILGTMTMIVLDKVGDNAHANQTKAMLMKLSIALEKYKEDNGDYPEETSITEMICSIDSSNPFVPVSNLDDFEDQYDNPHTALVDQGRHRYSYHSDYLKSEYFNYLKTRIADSYLTEVEFPIQNIYYKCPNGNRRLYFVDAWFNADEDMKADPDPQPNAKGVCPNDPPLHSLQYRYDSSTDITYTLFSKGSDDWAGYALIEGCEDEWGDPLQNEVEEGVECVESESKIENEFGTMSDKKLHLKRMELMEDNVYAQRKR